MAQTHLYLGISLFVTWLLWMAFDSQIQELGFVLKGVLNYSQIKNLTVLSLGLMQPIIFSKPQGSFVNTSPRLSLRDLTTARFLSIDFCSSLKITDQSNQKISCTIFCEKLDGHPKIFQIGDVIRMHRVKVQTQLLFLSLMIACC